MQDQIPLRKWLFLCCACVFCDGCAKKILMNIENIQQYRTLQYTVCKDDDLVRHHDVTLFCFAPPMRNQQFVTATVVRSILVAFRIFYVVEVFLRNNNSNTLSGYSEE